MTESNDELTITEVEQTLEQMEYRLEGWDWDGDDEEIAKLARALLDSQKALEDAERHVTAIRSGGVEMTDRHKASLEALRAKLRAALLKKGESDGR